MGPIVRYLDGIARAKWRFCKNFVWISVLVVGFGGRSLSNLAAADRWCCKVADWGEGDPALAFESMQGNRSEGETKRKGRAGSVPVFGRRGNEVFGKAGA